MSTQSVFKFSARFLSAVSALPVPHAGHKSKMMSRRAEMRRSSEWEYDENIYTAPAITDIDVVAFVPELVPEDEMITMYPAMVSGISKDEHKPALATIEPAHADRDVVIPLPIEELNPGSHVFKGTNENAHQPKRTFCLERSKRL